MSLENQEKNFYVFFALHLLLFTLFFMTLNRIFTFCINQPHLFLKVIDNKKKKLILNVIAINYVKSVRIRSYFGLHFPATSYWVQMRVYADKSNSEYGHFLRSYKYTFWILLIKTYVRGANEKYQKWLIWDAFDVCLIQAPKFKNENVEYRRNFHKLKFFAFLMASSVIRSNFENFKKGKPKKIYGRLWPTQWIEPMTT